MIYVTFFGSEIQIPDVFHGVGRLLSNKGSRLDFFLVSDRMQENIESANIIPSVWSDHSAIKTNWLCSLQEGSRRQGCWKFNSWLIEDKNLVEPLKTEILNFRRDADHFDDVATR